MKKVIVTLAMVLGALVALVAAPASTPHAQAGVFGGQVCHNGYYTNPPIAVLESGGASYLVYPGHCTPGDVPIFGFRPSGWGQAVTYYRSGHRYTCQYNGGSQWCGTVGQSINVTSAYYTGDSGSF